MNGDPSGLLQRIPELRPLCDADRRVARAVASGDPFRVYRVLALAWLLKRLPEHRETLSLLVHRRRLFARPLTGNPTLFTLNSVGVGFVGESEREPDGTHVTTHCLVALFAVPLFPLGAYLVQAVPGDGVLGRSSWRIFARVPLGLWTWAWSRGLALAATMAVVAGGAQAFRASRYHEVTVLNGFGVPVVVRGGEQRLVVASGGRASLTLPVGTQALRAEGEDGTEVEAFSAEVRSGGQELVWNVAGAAPLFLVDVVYTSREAKQPDPRPTLLCGQRWVERRDVDYAFREPPRSLQVNKSTGQTVRHLLDVAPAPATQQLMICVSALARERKPLPAMALLEAAAGLAHWKGEPGEVAAGMVLYLAPARALEVASWRREAEPGDLQAHRVYQLAAEAAGQRDQVLADYRARALAAPGSAQAQYLLARLFHGRERREQAERAAAAFPDDPDVQNMALSQRVARGDWDGALKAWRAIAAQPASPVKVWALEPAAVALVATGRAAEAAALVEGQFTTLEDNGQRLAAALYAHLEALQGKPDGDQLLGRLEKGRRSGLARIAAGVMPRKPPEGILEEFAQALPRDPARARALAAELNEVDLLELPELGETWLLAYAEAVRVGDAKARDSLARVPWLSPTVRRRIDRYVRGEAEDSEDFDLPTRAVASFVRSRNTSLAPMEREALVAAARHDDWLHTAVTEAIDAWPPPASGR